MEHIFILKGLDCPNCSAKIEKEVGELAGVQLSSMNLMKQTLTVQAEASEPICLIPSQPSSIVTSRM